VDWNPRLHRHILRRRTCAWQLPPFSYLHPLQAQPGGLWQVYRNEMQLSPHGLLLQQYLQQALTGAACCGGAVGLSVAEGRDVEVGMPSETISTQNSVPKQS